MSASILPAMKIEMLPGILARSFVDPFYAAHDSGGSARDTDIFFLALAERNLLGTVRFCVEENTPMLRTMLVHSDFRGRHVGQALLDAFESFLERENQHNVFCLPHAHLEKFYGSIDFRTVGPDETPPFLLVRMATYRAKGMDAICMRRN